MPVEDPLRALALKREALLHLHHTWRALTELMTEAAPDVGVMLHYLPALHRVVYHGTVPVEQHAVMNALLDIDVDEFHHALVTRIRGVGSGAFTQHAQP